MFHFPTFPPHALCVQARVTPHDWCGVPPFGNPRINARLTAPRGLSQPPTSFIGSWCPGIHRVPLTTWPHKHPRPSTTKLGPTPAEREPDPDSWWISANIQLHAYIKYRCSRPLCSSQSTEDHRPSDTASPGSTGRYDTRTISHQSSPTHPTAFQRQNRPVPSGPNSVPTTSHPRPPTFHTPRREPY
jgi:hypothetical protein